MGYYCGDLDEDLNKLKQCPELRDTLDDLGKKYGYGRCQQILQVMWAKMLRDNRNNTMGALCPDPLADENKS